MINVSFHFKLFSGEIVSQRYNDRMDIIREAKRQSTIGGTKKSIGVRFYRKCPEMWASSLVWSCSTYGPRHMAEGGGQDNRCW